LRRKIPKSWALYHRIVFLPQCLNHLLFPRSSVGGSRWVGSCDN